MFHCVTKHTCVPYRRLLYINHHDTEPAGNNGTHVLRGSAGIFCSSHRSGIRSSTATAPAPETLGPFCRSTASARALDSLEIWVPLAKTNVHARPCFLAVFRASIAAAISSRQQTNYYAHCQRRAWFRPPPPPKPSQWWLTQNLSIVLENLCVAMPMRWRRRERASAARVLISLNLRT